ncbi:MULTISPECIES: hypothetical protein [unclassified Ensifer]|uniref:hypothetical protein n=1 Tax=unclassified Ensifer TaxID=2633371 RepID=UPI0008139CE1|nr:MULTISPECIES: hypothetical protein [unclassified Ensifer]OCP08000.1 hypothetical protein BC362_10340 [Ensifer sp. LC14]OCP10890.1 hypothetical protein BC374_17625 [Ensifer sp. LC13]OCP11564.1 hypothetical protein BBX50_18230 [Ensifer sp. LC11]OCP33383.1 hypothetical protein BC364_17120 [Ensifer sp. LC499]
MLKFLQPYFAYAQIGALVLIAGFVGFLWVSIANKKAEIARLETRLSSLQETLLKAVDAAEANREMINKVDAARRRQLDAVNQEFEAYKQQQAALDAMDAEIDAAADQDGPLAPILKNWRPPQ